MDGQRLGLLVRALRRKRGWTQQELARRVSGSQAAISRLERGGVHGLSLGLLARVVSELGGRLKVDILADGENVARLLDADHASIVELVTRLLADLGWELWPEATFSVFGERGSIDILAFHPPTGSLLVIEGQERGPGRAGDARGYRPEGAPRARPRRRARVARPKRVALARPA